MKLIPSLQTRHLRAQHLLAASDYLETLHKTKGKKGGWPPVAI